MAFTKPAAWNLHGSSNNGNTVQYTLPGHTAQTPRIAVFKRTAPVYANSRWSKPTYDCKVVFGVVDADGNPVTPYVQVGTDGIRFPMTGVSVAAAVADAVTAFRLIVDQADFAAAIVAQQFPS